MTLSSHRSYVLQTHLCSSRPHRGRGLMRGLQRLRDLLGNRRASSSGIGPCLIRNFHFGRRIRAFIHQHPSAHARFLHRTLFRSSAEAALGVEPTRAPAFRPFLRHRSTLMALSSPEFSSQRSPAILPALAAPRSSAACRRTADGSDALPPAGASSTAHASPDGPPSSPAAAGDS